MSIIPSNPRLRTPDLSEKTSPTAASEMGPASRMVEEKRLMRKAAENNLSSIKRIPPFLFSNDVNMIMEKNVYHQNQD